MNFDLWKFGNFCHRPPLLMFAPVDENLATPLITTSGVLVDLYRRFGASLAWINVGKQPRFYPKVMQV